MLSNRDKKTSFIKYYNEIRPIIRVYLLDGNKTIDDFIKSKICGCESSYTQLKHKITLFLGNYMKERRLPSINKKAVSLPENMFEYTYNYLCDTYTMCSDFRGKRIGIIVLIMQMLQQNKQGMSAGQITKKLELCEATYNKELMKELIDLGLIYINEHKYHLYENIFESVSDPLAFLDFISLCRNIIDPYTCGNMIMETAINYFKHCGNFEYKYNNPFIVSGNYFYQVIDDEIEWRLITAMTENKSVEITYNTHNNDKTQPQEIYPIKIKTDKSSGRRYVYGVNAKTNVRSFYRLDKIKKLTFGNNSFEAENYFETYYNDTRYSVYGVTIPNENSYAEIVINFKEGMHKQIKELFKNCEIDMERLTAKIKLNTVKEIKPWLFKNIDNVYIENDSNCGLKDEMIKDIEEWRNMYGIV